MVAGSTVPVRKRACRLPAAERRDQILDAAIRLFARTGFRDASTATLAAELGVSEPTLYRHFPSKRALYLAALDHSAGFLLGKWRELAKAAPTPLDALREIGRWYFEQLAREPGHLQLRFRSFTQVDDEEIAAHARARFVSGFHFVHGLYEAARKQGQIAAATDTATHTWIYMAVGALIDTTQILGLRDMLQVEDLAAIMRLVRPLLPEPPRARRPRRKTQGRKR
jgi:AcrR family transcriptional regulator